MAYRETCDDCIKRKLEDERLALLVKPPSISVWHSLSLLTSFKLKGLSLGPIKRIGILFGILGGLGASASLWFVLPLPAPLVVWIAQCFASLYYFIEMDDHSKTRKWLMGSWALVAFPLLGLWGLQKWIRGSTYRLKEWISTGE